MCYNRAMERFLDYFKPSNYTIDLEIDRHKKSLKGKVRVSGVVCSECVKFHAVAMKIKSVEFSADDPFSQNPLKPCRFEYDDETIMIPTDRENAPYFYTSHKFDERSGDSEIHSTDFVITFETKLKENMQGCYLSSYDLGGEKKFLATTQFESHYAREAFPCIDEPAAKAIFFVNLDIPDLSPEDVVLFNTPLSSHYGTRYSFAPTPRMSTYLLAWVIGPLQSVSTVNKNGVQVSSYCALNQPLESLLFANEVATRALEYYDEKFGEQCPLSKLDQVALPDFEAGAMENWGLVTYRESMMLAGPDASLDLKRTVSTTVTHELSHQWFGDLVTMAWWDGLWLNESFATIMEYYAADALYPELGVWEDFFTGDCLAALKRDALSGVQAVQQEVQYPAEIATLFDAAIVYAKGARLILMLVRLMGEDNFYSGMRYYFDKHKYQNTTGDDLWSALQPHADFDVKKFMQVWITQPGYPILEAHGNDWSEKRFLIAGGTDDGSKKWPLPEVKDDMSGHYLIKLSMNEFSEKLSKFVEMESEQKLRLLIDRMLLAKAGEVESASLLDLISQFANEKSSAVWEILANIIGDLKLFCPPETALADNYKKFLRESLSEQFAEIDFGALSDSNQLVLRSILLSIAYYAEDQPTLKRLLKLYQSDLSKLDADLRPHILSAKLYFDEEIVFADWLEYYRTTSNPELKHSLLAELAGSVKEERHCQRMLDLLKKPEIVRPQDHIYLYIYLLRNFRTRERTLIWLTENWEYLVGLTGDKSVEDYPRYAANLIRTASEAKVFHDFFQTKRDVPVLKRTLEIAETEISARLKLIEHEQPLIKEKLNKLTKEK